MDAVRECLRDGGFIKTSDGVEEGGQFLLGYRGRLFEVDSDFQVGESVDGTAAVGCGAEVALGSLYTSRGMAPEDRILNALLAAEFYAPGVRGPFKIERLAA